MVCPNATHWLRCADLFLGQDFIDLGKHEHRLPRIALIQDSTMKRIFRVGNRHNTRKLAPSSTLEQYFVKLTMRWK